MHVVQPQAGQVLKAGHVWDDDRQATQAQVVEAQVHAAQAARVQELQQCHRVAHGQVLRPQVPAAQPQRAAHAAAERLPQKRVGGPVHPQVHAHLHGDRGQAGLHSAALLLCDARASHSGCAVPHAHGARVLLHAIVQEARQVQHSQCMLPESTDGLRQETREQSPHPLPATSGQKQRASSCTEC